ncbi:putative DSBA family oxidoreductase [Dactylonectria estremocensis]|uniref:Glutathione S-transferase kappa n=1 Tax=Dactylonectria estremocensis TaxID=1079267 RepID=A0A9P9D2E1_9HYPO|nr:putative DSBA family oxidoreductase [Dactylonectria estremocensis]
MPSHDKKIEAYLDCVSPYSFYSFCYLLKNRRELQSQGVKVEFVPVFLGGINVGSGNKPPWTLPAKANHSQFDSKRAQKYFGLNFEIPDFFPILSLLPQRCLTYLKAKRPEKLEDLFQSCFETLWLQHLDLSKPEHMLTALLKVFSKQEAEGIMQAAQTPEVKQALSDVTKYAVEDLGAFGCPWFWVHDGKGNAEPFFGSDRFHYMWDYLEILHRDLELQGPVSGKL